MNDSGSDCVLEDYSDADRLRVIRGALLARMDDEATLLTIALAVFSGTGKGG